MHKWITTHLEVASPGDVDDGGLLGVLLVLLARLLGDERPEAVQVDGGAVLRRHVRVHVEVPHANLNGRRKKIRTHKKGSMSSAQMYIILNRFKNI